MRYSYIPTAIPWKDYSAEPHSSPTPGDLKNEGKRKDSKLISLISENCSSVSMPQTAAPMVLLIFLSLSSNIFPKVSSLFGLQAYPYTVSKGKITTLLLRITLETFLTSN